MGPVIDDVMITRPWPLAVSASKRGLNDEHRALEVHREHLLDVLGRQVFEPARWEDAGVGADDVQAAVSLDGGVDRASAIVRVRHIGAQAADLPGMLPEGRHGRVHVGLGSRGHQHVDACGGKGFGDTAADSLAAAGDDGGSALK